jgi:hypothetical protein
MRIRWERFVARIEHKEVCAVKIMVGNPERKRLRERINGRYGIIIKWTFQITWTELIDFG